MKILPYCESDYAEVNDFINLANPKKFINTPKFISYHGDKFEDCSLVIKNEKSNIIGFFPSAKLNGEIISHPGSTFGGLITTLKKLVDIFEIYDHILEFYRKDHKKLIVKLSPLIYLNEQSSVEELYFLLKGFELSSFYATSIIDLKNPLPISKKLKGNIRRVKKLDNLNIYHDMPFDNLYDQLKKSLSDRHGTAPTHSLEDLKLLKKLFPKEIYSIAAVLDDQILAGSVVFESGFIAHTQYLFNTNQGMRLGVLDLVIHELIEKTKISNHYLSFGSSSENQGKYLNMGLLKFKEKFGSFIQLGKTFEINLN